MTDTGTSASRHCGGRSGQHLRRRRRFQQPEGIHQGSIERDYRVLGFFVPSITTPSASGMVSAIRSSGPKFLVTCPFPVVSSIRLMCPGPARTWTPPDTSTSELPDSVITNCRAGPVCQSGEFGSVALVLRGFAPGVGGRNVQRFARRSPGVPTVPLPPLLRFRLSSSLGVGCAALHIP